MARARLSTAFTLLTGAAGGFLVAVLLQEPPAPADGPPPADDPAARQAPIRHLRDSAESPSDVPAGTPSGPATLAGILRLQGEFQQTAALYGLITVTDSAELERLIVEADSLTSGSDRRGALSILYGRYADLDPGAALDFLLSRATSHNEVEVRALFHGWARRDLTAAVEAAAGLPERLRVAAGAAILSSRDTLPADAQRDIARRLDIEHLREQLAMQRMLDQVDRDPLTAWQTALNAAGGPMRQQRLMGIVHGWARQDPRAAMEAVTSLRDVGLRAQLQLQIVHQWGQQDPQEAVTWVLGQPPSPQRGQLSAAALGAMAESDPRTAFDIAQGLQGQERANTVGRILSTWARSDPAAAARMAELVSGSIARQGSLYTIAAAYAQADPQGALQWADRLEPMEGNMVVSVIFNSLAQRNPVQAASLLSMLPDEARRAQAAASVASAWAQQDPAAAARWAETLVDDPVRAQATANAVQAWAGYDRDAALRFAENLPLAADRDAALVAIMQAQHDDTELGVRIFERLTDPAQRAMAAQLLYYQLRETDPERAERYRQLGGASDATAVFRVEARQ